MRLGLALLCLVACACGEHTPGGMTGPTMNNRIAPVELHPLESAEILERPQQAATVSVRHILLGYKGLKSNYETPMDPRAAKRTREQAEVMVKELLQKINGGSPFVALLLEHSEDAGSAKTGRAYRVEAAADLDPQFIKLSLRLKVGEVGVVRSPYGFHIVRRAR